MATDWALIRQILARAVDACEAYERLQLSEADRAKPTSRPGVSVFDVLTSAWTYPETLQYRVVRMRHELGADAPYRPEIARVLREIGALCAELVNAPVDDVIPGARDGEAPTIRREAEALCEWYSGVMSPLLSTVSLHGSD